MRHNHKKLYTGVIVVGIIVLACMVYGLKVKTSGTVEIPTVIPPRNGIATELPMLAVYKDKIVYTSDTTSPKEDYVSDCSFRGGKFNACGNGCAPGGEICALSCVYTCTLPEGDVKEY